MREGKLLDRECGREEKKVGMWDPSGKTYMKAASRRWCVSKKWERGLKKREMSEKKEAKEQFRTSLAFLSQKFLQRSPNGRYLQISAESVHIMQTVADHRMSEFPGLVNVQSRSNSSRFRCDTDSGQRHPLQEQTTLREIWIPISHAKHCKLMCDHVWDVFFIYALLLDE